MGVLGHIMLHISRYLVTGGVNCYETTFKRNTEDAEKNDAVLARRSAKSKVVGASLERFVGE